MSPHRDNNKTEQGKAMKARKSYDFLAFIAFDYCLRNAFAVCG